MEYIVLSFLQFQVCHCNLYQWLFSTSFEVAVINWTVSAVAYTPETFHIEYTKEGSMDREISAAVVMDTFNFSATDVVQSFIPE